MGVRDSGKTNDVRLGVIPVLSYSAGVFATELLERDGRVKSDVSRRKSGLPNAGEDCCIRIMSPTLCNNDCCDLDLSRMAAEADLFFKIGFFEMNEDECDNRLGGGVLVLVKRCLGPVCSGP